MNKNLLNISLKKNSILILLLIIIFSVLIDKIYHANTFYLPGWDQGYHLTNLFSTYNIFTNIKPSSLDWWDNLWRISDTYRGPFTYIISSFFLLIFGKNYENSLISNHIFSIITILCIFNISKEIENKKGFLASVLKKLNNKRFVENAPKNVVELELKKKDDAQKQIKILETRLKNLND